jgi:hypothetical protein
MTSMQRIAGVIGLSITMFAMPAGARRAAEAKVPLD